MNKSREEILSYKEILNHVSIRKSNSETNQEAKATLMQKAKKATFMFLERPHTKAAFAYHFIPPLLVLGSLCFGVAGTIQKYENRASFRTYMLSYEVFLLVFFVIEYILRIWSCDHVKLYRGFRGKFRFLTSLYMSVDAFVIISTAITSCMEVRAGLTLLQVARFFQIFRLLRIDRRRGDLITMAKVVRIHGKELITCYFIGSIILYCGAYLVYIAERFSFEEDGRHYNETSIHDMTDSLYWAVITVTSVGYGDFSPTTWGGKIITCAFAIVGTAFFALPAGIIGSGFALQISKRKKLKQHRKLRNPAACLIQRFWRLYAIGNDGREASFATTAYLLSKMQFQSKRKSSILHDIEEEFFQYTSPVHPSPSAFTTSLVDKNERAVKANNDLEKRRKTNDVVSEGCFKSIVKAICELMNCKKEKEVPKETIKPWHDKFSIRKLPARYRHAILFLHRINLWIAMKNFKNLRNPFLNMEDMMEKNTRHHVEMITHFEDINDAFVNISQQFQSLQTSNQELKCMVLSLTEALNGKT